MWVADIATRMGEFAESRDQVLGRGRHELPYVFAAWLLGGLEENRERYICPVRHGTLIPAASIPFFSGFGSMPASRSCKPRSRQARLITSSSCAQTTIPHHKFNEKALVRWDWQRRTGFTDTLAERGKKKSHARCSMCLLTIFYAMLGQMPRGSEGEEFGVESWDENGGRTREKYVLAPSLGL
ncbi:hypothetical protein PgNI_10198 [Pyricularia grisea]|uniref:Uncharacterized protein n=1 Tax=Pyricularia grisea TaxID=148305 RepID=A0A6P8AZK3_PYRGI|nr:hypothetical protein PgNI_10198 [Pyricularia grisea]TLD07729.1 hypothetical protein PgNI_10198 [Pyricularia grisea]